MVSIVAEMTGYPPELLDLDLDLEADLGVDTVKQAEVFAAVRERFGVERDDSLSLREFPTLTHVIGWVRERTGGQPACRRGRRAGRPEPAARLAGRSRRPAAGGRRGDRGGGVDRGGDDRVPAGAAGPGSGPGGGLGVDTVKQAEVFAAVRERFGVERDDSVSLRDFPTLTHVIGWIRERTGGRAGSPTPAAEPRPWRPGRRPAHAARAVHPTTVVGDLDAVDRMPRRVPVPALRPDLDHCVPTGVTPRRRRAESS